MNDSPTSLTSPGDALADETPWNCSAGGRALPRLRNAERSNRTRTKETLMIDNLPAPTLADYHPHPTGLLLTGAAATRFALMLGLPELEVEHG